MTWEFVYSKEFAHVYDADHTDRVDLSWDGDRLGLTGQVELDLDGVVRLRKLLQAVERKAKQE